MVLSLTFTHVSVYISGGYSICTIHWTISSSTTRCKEVWHHLRKAKAGIMDWGKLHVTFYSVIFEYWQVKIIRTYVAY